MHVETTVTGKRRRTAAEVAIDGSMPLRSLVERLVRAEVDASEQRRAERVLTRVLTSDEVADGAAAGKVDSGGRRAAPAPPAEMAAETALQAFTDGLWVVFVDGEQVHDLDTVVDVGADTRVRFVRLVALAGG